MRLPLVICSLVVVFAPNAARKDFKETCTSKKSCVLPCHFPEALSEVMWSKDMFAVQWFPQNEIHYQHPRYRNRTSLFVREIQNGNCSLVINDVKPEDSGIYKCVPTSQSRKEESFYYNLTVNAPVEEVVIEQSGDFLICSSKQVHPKPECRWSGTILNSTVQQDNQLFYSITCITPLLHNVSQYNCRVSTPFSSKTATYTQLPPVTISGPEASLHCGPSVGPVKTMSWRFNHSNIIVNQSSRQQVSERWRLFVRSVSESGDLRLENLTSHQQGLFTCITSTDTETYTATVWLEMKESLSLSVNTVIAAVVTAAVLTFLTLSAYRRFQTTSEAPASDPQKNRSQSQSAAVPQDRFRALQFICGLLGLESVLPWHFFMTSSLYFKHRMDGQWWVLSLLVLVTLLPHLISEGFNYFFVFRFSQRKHTSGCLVMITLIFVAMLITVKVQMAGETFFGISMCALWLASLFSSMVQRSLSVEMNLLPPIHRQSFAYGQASAGVLASAVMIVCVAVTEDTDLPVFCHFFFALVVSVAALFTYWILQHNEFAKYHFNKERQISEESSLELLASNDQKNNNSEHQQPPNGLLPDSLGNVCAVFYVTSVPIISFSVYPAITADVHTAYPGGRWERCFILVCCFLTYHILHFTGQNICIIPFVRKHTLIVFPVLVFIHTAFIPWFMFCNVQPRAFLPVHALMSNDIAFIFGMALFSFCDGFLTHLSLLYEPNSERDAGTGSSKILWKAFGGIIGAIIGALISFAIRARI